MSCTLFGSLPPAVVGGSGVFDTASLFCHRLTLSPPVGLSYRALLVPTPAKVSCWIRRVHCLDLVSVLGVNVMT